MKVHFHTLGCRVNQYDTEALRSAFSQMGFEPATRPGDAQVSIVNTCSVTAESDRKCRGAIRRLRRENPEAFLAVTGCYASGAPEDLEAMPEVDLVAPSRGKDPRAVALGILESLGLHCPAERGTAMSILPTLTEFAEHTRAFIKIEDGCDQMCTYCRIPFYRGRARSRPSCEVLEEIRNLARRGYREVVLCGVQLGAFGRDSGESLPNLLRAIHEMEGIERFRLSSIEPDDVSEELIETLLSLPKAAPHLHLPLQSGDDGILRAMRRRYDFDYYRALAKRLREANPEFAISTDIMVGFPGESDEAFENSIRAAKEIEFCRLHLFRYSPRPGTRAAAYPNRVPKGILDARRHRLGIEGAAVVNRVRERQIGRTLSVMLEEEGAGDALAVGFSENYLRVQARFDPDGSPDWKKRLGRLTSVRIDGMDSEYLLGSPVI
jgi:threonylcarbamoyladenosine tRNA methylthiotransferase MtaB